MARIKSVVFSLSTLLHIRLAVAQVSDPTLSGFTGPTVTVDPATLPSATTDASDPGEPCTNGLPCRQGQGGVYHWGPYVYNCGFFATGDSATLHGAAADLYDESKLGWDEAWQVKPGLPCTRVFCLNSSAIWVCTLGNPGTDNEPLVFGYHIGHMVNRTLDLCCNELRGGKSGEMRHELESYRAVFGYASCNDSSDVPPFGYGGNGAVNNSPCVA